MSSRPPAKKNLRTGWTRTQQIVWSLAIGVIVLLVAGVIGVLIYQGNSRAASSSEPTSAAGATSMHSISGTVTYRGTQAPGRVYIYVYDQNGQDTGLGTSVLPPYRYTIRGVTDGQYFLRVWMDTTSPATAVPNAVSPSGTVSVTVSGGDASEQNITIADPSPVPDAKAPTNLTAAPSKGAVLVQWSAPVDEAGAVAAQSYNVYYSTSNPVNQATATKRTVSANHIFIGGLQDGTTYYFAVSSVLLGRESVLSAPALSATAGAPAEGNTISGSISFSAKATGPLYVGVTGQEGTFFSRIDRPASPQAFSIEGVPDGTYSFYSRLDMNANGVIDAGDITRFDNNPAGADQFITVSGNATGLSQTLIGSNVMARVVTMHFGAAESPGQEMYNMGFELTGNRKVPARVSLISGKNVALPVDIGGVQNYYHLFASLEEKPAVGDTYTFDIAYTDGTSEKLKLPITGVIEGFPQNLTASGADRTKPTFNWEAPSSAPESYSYLVQLGERSIGREWTYPYSGTMPSTQTSLVYNADGRASLTALQTGTTYDWLVYVIDDKGNQAIYQSSYTP